MPDTANDIGFGLCPQCWYRAWTPVSTEEECVRTHPHAAESGHIRCDYCWMRQRRDDAYAEGLERGAVIADEWERRHGITVRIVGRPDIGFPGQSYAAGAGAQIAAAIRQEKP